MALGITWSLPEDDRHNRTKEELLAMITRAMGGRFAEEIKFGDVTTGASNDFEQATELARRMVTQYGMSELGPIQYGRGAHQVFLGRDISEERNYSEEVASKIDGEVRKIIETCYADGKRILDRELGQGRANGRVAARVRNGRSRGSASDSRSASLRSRARRSRAVRRGASRAAGRRRAEARREAARGFRRKYRRNRHDAARGLRLATLVVAALSACARCRLPRRCRSSTGSLPRGGSYVLDPDPTVGSAAIGLWFRAPGAGYDNATPGISNLAATAAAVAPLASGKSLYALVHTVGGELNIEVYPDIVGIGAVVPASAARRVVAAMTAAYFAPSIDDTAVKTARANAAVLGVQQRYESDSTLHDLLFAQIFAGGPAHYPPLPTRSRALTSISTAQVNAFAKRAFRSENAVLTLTGNVDASSIGAVTDGSGGGSMDAPFDSPLAQVPASATATGAIDGVGLGLDRSADRRRKGRDGAGFRRRLSLPRCDRRRIEGARSSREATRSSSVSSSRCTIRA